MNHTERDEHSNSWNLAKKTVFTIGGLLFSSFLMQLPIYAEDKMLSIPFKKSKKKRVRKKDKTHQMNQV